MSNSKVATGTYVCLKTHVLKTEMEHFPSFLRSQFEGYNLTLESTKKSYSLMCQNYKNIDTINMGNVQKKVPLYIENMWHYFLQFFQYSLKGK